MYKKNAKKKIQEGEKRKIRKWGPLVSSVPGQPEEQVPLQIPVALRGEGGRVRGVEISIQ